MRIMERISGLTSKVISRLSIKQFVDINELPLFKTPNYMFRLKYWLGALVAAAFICGTVAIAVYYTRRIGALGSGYRV